MIDRQDITLPTLSMIVCWFGAQAAAFWLALPFWAQFLAHISTSVISLVLGIIVTHFLRRFLQEKWPLKKGMTKD